MNLQTPEFEAFKAYCEEYAKQPFSAKKRAGINFLQSFASGQYGGSAHRQIISIFRTEAVAESREVRMGKGRGDRQSRQSSPEQPIRQTRADRQAAREARAVRLEARSPVAGGDGIMSHPVSTDSGEFVVTTSKSHVADADISAKELVEKYGRDSIVERLIELGESAEDLESKTDRQVANLLKKRLSDG